MDLRELTKLALKLAGVYMIVNVLIALPSVVFAGTAYPIEAGVSLALYGLVGLALFLIPGRLVNRVLHMPSELREGAPSAENLLRVGSVLLGVYFTVTALYGVLYTFAKARWFYQVAEPYPGFSVPTMTPDDFAYLVASAAQVLLGIFLWFGRSFVARIAYRSDDDR